MSSRSDLVNHVLIWSYSYLALHMQDNLLLRKKNQQHLWTGIKWLIHYRKPSIPRCPLLILMMSEQGFSLHHPNCASSIKQMLDSDRAQCGLAPVLWGLCIPWPCPAPGARSHLHWSIISRGSETVFSVNAWKRPPDWDLFHCRANDCCKDGYIWFHSPIWWSVRTFLCPSVC